MAVVNSRFLVRSRLLAVKNLFVSVLHHMSTCVNEQSARGENFVMCELLKRFIYSLIIYCLYFLLKLVMMTCQSLFSLLDRWLIILILDPRSEKKKLLLWLCELFNAMFFSCGCLLPSSLFQLSLQEIRVHTSPRKKSKKLNALCVSVVMKLKQLGF